MEFTSTSLASGCLDRITLDTTYPFLSSTSSGIINPPLSLLQECLIAFLILTLHTREVNTFALSVVLVLTRLRFIVDSTHKMVLEVSILCLFCFHSVSLCLMRFLKFTDPLRWGEIWSERDTKHRGSPYSTFFFHNKNIHIVVYKIFTV